MVRQREIGTILTFDFKEDFGCDENINHPEHFSKQNKNELDGSFHNYLSNPHFVQDSDIRFLIWILF